MNTDRLVKIKLHDPSKGMDAGWYEAVWAEVTDDGHARLRNQPVSFSKLRYGDVVEVKALERNGYVFLYSDAESNVE